jgi:hypothetical protein
MARKAMGSGVERTMKVAGWGEVREGLRSWEVGGGGLRGS